MELKYKLLDHPFYKAWSCGEISDEQLSMYHQSYRELIEDMPILWKKVTDGLNVTESKAEQIIKEETTHINLWDEWGIHLDKLDSYPSMSRLRDILNKMTVSELLGAIHAFEIQQPEVAKSKKEGLLNHYAIENKSLAYFDEHLNEHEHIAFGSHLAKKYAQTEEFNRGFAKGSEEFYIALDLFL